MDKPQLRWGILGTANIAQKNWKAIWNSRNGCVTAVASRDPQRSRRFIDECQAQAPFPTAPRALGSYEELLVAPDVDAVYIPLPTGIRGRWVKGAAEAGKHVLCEKPCATSLVELVEMLDVCQRNRVQFMDDVMFLHSRRLERIREVLDNGHTVGSIRRITSAFTFRAEEDFFVSNIRAQSDLEPDGCLGDLGWYCIRFALWAMNWKVPQRVTGRVLSEFKHASSKLPVPTEFSAELLYPDGVTSSFYCSFLTGDEQWANVSGTRGYLRVPDFVLPHYGAEVGFEVSNPVYHIAGCDFNMEDHKRRVAVREYSNSAPNSQEANMFRNFAALVLSGRPDDSYGIMVLKTQQVLDACLQSAASEGRTV